MDHPVELNRQCSKNQNSEKKFGAEVKSSPKRSKKCKSRTTKKSCQSLSKVANFATNRRIWQHCYLALSQVTGEQYLVDLLQIITVNQDDLFQTLWEPSVNRKYLQALTLVGPTWSKPVLDPLAVLHLDNRLHVFCTNIV